MYIEMITWEISMLLYRVLKPWDRFMGAAERVLCEKESLNCLWINYSAFESMIHGIFVARKLISPGTVGMARAVPSSTAGGVIVQHHFQL